MKPPKKLGYFNTPSAKRTTHIFRGWHSWLTYARHSQRGACELHINLLNKITINKPLRNTLLCINLFSLSFDTYKPFVAWNLFFIYQHLLQIGNLSDSINLRLFSGNLYLLSLQIDKCILICNKGMNNN